MGVALAAAAARRGADVTLIAANVALDRAGRRRARRRRDDRRARRAPCASEFADCHVLLMAAAVGRLPRRARAEQGKIARDGGGAASSCGSSRPRTSSPGSPPAAARARRSSASPPSTAARRSSAPARSSSARASTRSSSTTSRAPRSASTRERQRGHDRRARRRAPRAARLQGRGRRRDPRPRRGAREPAGTSGSGRRRGASHTALRTLDPCRSDDTYTLYRRGVELLEDGSFGAGDRAARRGGPAGAGEELGPRGARPRLLPQPPVRRGGDGVRGRRRALPGQRLRPLLPRPGARA